MTRNARTLPQIAKAIKALEKKSIQSVVEIGRLLHEASEQCEHGEYLTWVRTEFAWSDETSRRYRSVYELAQNPQIVDFGIGNLNISISALYLAAKCLKGTHLDSEQAVGKAIIEAAKQGRVGYRRAYDIWHKTTYPPLNSESLESGAMTLRRQRREHAEDAKHDKHDLMGRIELLTATMQRLECFAADDPAWPRVIGFIGAQSWREILAMLQAVYDAHCGMGRKVIDAPPEEDIADDDHANDAKPRLH